jgi:hypothetical protein
VFGIALLGAIVTSAFQRSFLSHLVAAGFPTTAANQIAANAGAQSAAGRVTVASVLHTAPPGTTLSQAQAVVDSVHDGFVHAMHVGMLVAIGFLILATIISALFVRSHVTGRGEEFEGATGGH